MQARFSLQGYVWGDVVVVVDDEVLPLAHDGDGHVLGGQLHLVREAVPQRSQTVLHQLLQLAWKK